MGFIRDLGLGWVLGLAATLSLGGCVFGELGENLETLDRAGRVSFNVAGERFKDYPVIAALVRDEPGRVTVETYGIVPTDGALTLYCEPGAYLLIAFQDVSGNHRYDPGEPYATYGQPTPIEFWDGRDIEGLTLTLAMPVDAEGWTPTALRERGVEVADRLADFGSVVSLSDERFAREVARGGMWEPARFIAENRAGLFMLEAYDPEKIPVVFVHGIGGTPRHFETMIAELDRERFQPWVFYYPSALRLPLLGDYLQVAVERMRTAHGFERAFVVAHSMGGLVAWAGVRSHLRDIDTPVVDLLVTINSPLGGMASASLGVDYAPVVMPSWIDLDPESEFLATLYDVELPASLRYALFYGVSEDQPIKLPLPLEMLLGGDIVLDGEDFDDQTVSLDSQLHRPAVELADALHGHHVTHMGTLGDPQTIAALNRLLAERASNESDAPNPSPEPPTP
ncbi:MAG: alpha/beta fold hydrolase [Planctomycetota bacterium]